MSGLSTLGELTLEISKRTSALLTLNHHVDQLIFDFHEEEKEKELVEMMQHADAIKSAADRISREVAAMYARFHK
jgi:hypothetical protein